jgi:small subunit ribosomal protein S2
VTKHPDAIFLVDIMDHKTVINEAKKVGVPVVAMSSTNSDPSLVDCIIPGNDKSVRSIEFVVDYIKNAVEEGRKEYSSKPIKETSSK